MSIDSNLMHVDWLGCARIAWVNLFVANECFVFPSSPRWMCKTKKRAVNLKAFL